MRRSARGGEAESENEDEDVETIPLMNCPRNCRYCGRNTNLESEVRNLPNCSQQERGGK